MVKTIFITGTAGFVGFHVAKRCLDDDFHVVGLDNLNDFYDLDLKKSRLAILRKDERFHFVHADLVDLPTMQNLFAENDFGAVVHLAAQAGVRYSVEKPRAYIDSNIVGFLNVLECCRQFRTAHLVFASSSSVYGLNRKQPFSEADMVDRPASLYAATKKSNELMAHAYAHLYGIPITSLRFFTVYGPWGRPDMAVFKFTKAILENKPIDLYNHGEMKRDFTYVDDIVEGVVRMLDRPPQKNVANSSMEDEPAFRIYNIGNGNPITLSRLVSAIENACGKKAVKNLLPMQPGDVLETYADITRLNAETGFQPNTEIETGTAAFVRWYKEYYGISAQ